jgi:hypothetical protein
MGAFEQIDEDGDVSVGEFKGSMTRIWGLKAAARSARGGGFSRAAEVQATVFNPVHRVRGMMQDQVQI